MKTGINGQENADFRLLTLRQVADIVGIAMRTAWKWLATGQLCPADVQLGGKRGQRWRSDRLMEWIDAGCPRADAWESHRQLQTA